MAAHAVPIFDGDPRKIGLDRTIALGGTETAAVDISNFNKGMFYLSSEFNTDTITIYVSNSTDGAFKLLYKDGATTDFAFTAVGDTWNVIPEDCFAAGAIKIVTNSAVGAAATITFCLKT